VCYNKFYLTKKQLQYAVRYGDFGDEAAIRKQLEAIKVEPTYHASGFSHPEVPVILNTTRKIELLQWGLIPHWIKTPADAVKISNQTINVRLETMFEKKAFAEAARNKRCLILIDGFFEHFHQHKKTFPYLIKLINDEPITLAGIWDEWQDAASGLIKRTYSVVTTKANKTLSKIHNNPNAENGPRMPILLTKETEKAWLTEENKNSVLQLAQPCKDEWLETFTVRRLSGKESVGNQPEALMPYRYAELEESQGSLF